MFKNDLLTTIHLLNGNFKKSLGNLVIDENLFNFLKNLKILTNKRKEKDGILGKFMKLTTLDYSEFFAIILRFLMNKI